MISDHQKSFLLDFLAYGYKNGHLYVQHATNRSRQSYTVSKINAAQSAFLERKMSATDAPLLVNKKRPM